MGFPVRLHSPRACVYALSQHYVSHRCALLQLLCIALVRGLNPRFPGSHGSLSSTFLLRTFSFHSGFDVVVSHTHVYRIRKKKKKPFENFCMDIFELPSLFSPPLSQLLLYQSVDLLSDLLK